MKTWIAGLLGALTGAAVATAAVRGGGAATRAGGADGETAAGDPTSAVGGAGGTVAAGAVVGEKGGAGGKRREPTPGALEAAERLRVLEGIASPAVLAEVRKLVGERNGMEEELLEAREQLQRSIDPDRKVRPYDLTADQKQSLAKKCAITWDMPSPGGRAVVNNEDAGRLGLDEEGRQGMDAVLRDNDKWLDGEITRLYAEVTGDAKGGNELSVEAKWREIEDKTPREELLRVFQRISAERAGLPVPGAPSGSPAERMFRLLVANGDRVEQSLAAKVGPEMARKYRDFHNGFSGRWTSTYGCPREDGRAPAPATAEGLPGSGGATP